MGVPAALEAVLREPRPYPVASGGPLPARALAPNALPRRCAPQARSVRVAAAASRPTWLPNVTPPKYLDGTLAGDFGFDPLGLGADPQRLKWCAAMWIVRHHKCRWWLPQS